MAEETKKTKADKRVELFVPRGSDRDEPNFFICINGKNYLLPKGKKSLVPPEVKAEYDRSLRAQDRQEENKDAMTQAN